MSTTACIKLNQNTTGHQSILESKGYECRVDGDKLIVTVPGPVQGKDVTVDLTTDEGKALVQKTIEERGCFTYQTRWILADGQEKPFFGLVAVTKLGKLSAFVMKPESGKKSASTLGADVLNELGL